MDRRTDEFDKAKRRRFLETLAETGIVAQACAASGISWAQACRTWEKSPAFRAAWRMALDQATDTLEAEARRRAVEGWEKPVFYQGQPVGAIREYSDSLLMFLLRAHRPERFRDRTKEEGNEPVMVHIARFAPEVQEGAP